eukprot:TRINITY_DN29318_c0_g1_i12.p1 TRINITY_DN29318_c0_g1~~TRINITY_DN29318_c0_g1_i12.p1  ORF type:complete len:372 (+),score=21.67 TRINITY_DN29318_c0_g1_i12:1266-2381(+)
MQLVYCAAHRPHRCLRDTVLKVVLLALLASGLACIAFAFYQRAGDAQRTDEETPGPDTSVGEALLGATFGVVLVQMLLRGIAALVLFAKGWREKLQANEWAESADCLREETGPMSLVEIYPDDCAASGSCATPSGIGHFAYQPGKRRAVSRGQSLYKGAPGASMRLNLSYLGSSTGRGPGSPAADGTLGRRARPGSRMESGRAGPVGGKPSSAATFGNISQVLAPRTRRRPGRTLVSPESPPDLHRGDLRARSGTHRARGLGAGGPSLYAAPRGRHAPPGAGRITSPQTEPDPQTYIRSEQSSGSSSGSAPSPSASSPSPAAARLRRGATQAVSALTAAGRASSLPPAVRKSARSRATFTAASPGNPLGGV